MWGILSNSEYIEKKTDIKKEYDTEMQVWECDTAHYRHSLWSWPGAIWMICYHIHSNDSASSKKESKKLRTIYHLWLWFPFRRKIFAITNKSDGLDHQPWNVDEIVYLIIWIPTVFCFKRIKWLDMLYADLSLGRVLLCTCFN